LVFILPDDHSFNYLLRFSWKIIQTGNPLEA